MVRFGIVSVVLLVGSASASVADSSRFWVRTLEAVGRWQGGLGESEYWCRDDARMTLADLREGAARECAGRSGRVVAAPVEEEVAEGVECRARQRVVCAQ